MQLDPPEDIQESMKEMEEVIEEQGDASGLDPNY
jgi:hypothetical protein